MEGKCLLGEKTGEGIFRGHALPPGAERFLSKLKVVQRLKSEGTLEMRYETSTYVTVTNCSFCQSTETVLSSMVNESLCPTDYPR